MTVQATFGFLLEYVTDVEAAKQFYTDVIGLKVERYHPTYVQFKNFAIASDESLSGNRSPEQYWLVDDAEQAFNELSQKAEIVFPLTQKAFGKVFAVKDPAGQPLYLLEFSRTRPSQPAS
ncbi:MAG: VOC family protein [Anaerolineae bacterium]